MKELRADESGNACYHLVQYLLSFSVTSINIKIKLDVFLTVHHELTVH